jgi:hypothetical protein
MLKLKVMPRLENLEKLYIDRSQPNRQPHHAGATHTPSLDFAGSMLPSVTAGIRASRKLNTIHVLRDPHSTDFSLFDHLNDLEERNQTAGFVSSMKHGSSQLIYTRLLLDCFEVADIPNPTPGWSLAPTMGDSMPYTENSGQHRRKIYAQSALPIWSAHSDFEHGEVPLHVIDEIREAEGGDAVDWKRRDVEVSACSWKILVDWVRAARRRI